MPRLPPGPADRELQKLIEIFLRAETDIINEIGRLRSRGLVDYHVEAALERVQDILRKLESDCWTYVPRMIETHFYVSHPEARKPMEIPETPEKHLMGYKNARALTGEQMNIVQLLTTNLMGEITEANLTAMNRLENILLGRPEDDIFRRIGLEQSAAMQATGRGVYRALPDFVEALRRDGVTSFIDKAGRHWSLHTYGSMVLRTTSRQAEVMSVLTENPDHDLYKISKHGTTCRLCAPLEGRVYSKSGKDPDFPPLSAAFGKVDKNGPDTLENSWLNIHPNCLHQIIRWTPMGRGEEELQEIKDFSSFKKNPPSHDPRTKKQIEAYRKKEEARARFLRDYRQWERYRETLGDQIPKRFQTFQKYKAAGDDKYRAWEQAYREANRLAKSAESGIIKPNRPEGMPNVRRTAGPYKPKTFVDVTTKYLSAATPDSHTVQDLYTYTASGVTYKVDGRNVVLDYSPHEKEVAELLERKLGGEIFMVPRVNAPQGVSTPDYLFRGKGYDLKTIGAEAGPKTILNRIKKAKKQANCFVVDVTAAEHLSDVLINEQLGKIFRDREASFVDEIIVLRSGEIIKIVKRA